MVKSAQFRKIPIAALVAGVVLFSHAQPADAWWFTRDERLGRLTTADNMNYWQQKHLLSIGISSVNGSTVITMYGARLLVRRDQVYGRQIVTVGDGFGSNFFTTLLW